MLIVIVTHLGILVDFGATLRATLARDHPDGLTARKAAGASVTGHLSLLSVIRKGCVGVIVVSLEQREEVARA